MFDKLNYSFYNFFFGRLDTSCEEFSGLTFKVRFERLQTFYTRILLWPNIALLSLSSLMFFLPCESSDQANFGMTVLLTLSVNMMLITDFIPETSRHFPIVCNCFLASIFTCAVGVVMVCAMGRIKLHFQTIHKDAHLHGSCQTGLQLQEDNTNDEALDGNVENTTTSRCYQLRMKIIRGLIQHQNFVGFIYLFFTIIAHSWCYFGEISSSTFGI